MNIYAATRLIKLVENELTSRRPCISENLDDQCLYMFRRSTADVINILTSGAIPKWVAPKYNITRALVADCKVLHYEIRSMLCCNLTETEFRRIPKGPKDFIVYEDVSNNQFISIVKYTQDSGVEAHYISYHHIEPLKYDKMSESAEMDLELLLHLGFMDEIVVNQILTRLRERVKYILGR